MPIYNREKIYSVPIPMKGGTPLIYVFGSKQDMTGLTTKLGIASITDPSSIPAVGAFTGANSPKPPRGTVTIGTTGKKKSSFCDAAITDDEVDIKYPKNRARSVHLATDSSLVVSVYVELDGIKRAWNMSKVQYNLIQADFSELGIEACQENDELDYVWGCEAPFPARVKKYNPTGAEGGDTYTTFCSEAKEGSLQNWVKVSNRITVARYFGADDIINMAP